MKLRAPLRELIRSLIDFVYPPTCLVCGGTYFDGIPVCPDCKKNIDLGSCSYQSPQRAVRHIDEFSVLLPYDKVCRILIHALKYHGMPSMGYFLGEHMGKKTLQQLSLPKETLLVPVPLHPSKQKERGYNQSERLAKGFASFTGHTIDETILTRTRSTGTQTALDGEQRSDNVRGAFQYTGEKSLEGCPVILIDDVMTTGSTLSECAGVLRESGAGKIIVSVAATPDVSEDQQ